MKKVLSVIMVMVVISIIGISASAEIKVTEYLKETTESEISTFDTSVPTKVYSWSKGMYVGSLIDVKSWTYIQYKFKPNSSGEIHIMLQCGAGSSKETFKVTLYDASDKKFVQSISFKSNENGAVDKEKGKFSGLSTSKRYYLKFQHYSNNPCLSGSFLFVNDSSTFDI